MALIQPLVTTFHPGCPGVLTGVVVYTAADIHFTAIGCARCGIEKAFHVYGTLQDCASTVNPAMHTPWETGVHPQVMLPQL